MNRALVLKLGGELVETPAQRADVSAFAKATSRSRPLVIVHGGGRAVDAELTRRGIAPRKVEGLRVTDAATLDVVVSVLAGSANTDLVAALVAVGVRAVGLTGVDAGLGRATRTTAHQSTGGDVVDLGYVGDPVEADPALLQVLLAESYVPVIASIGLEHGTGASPTLLNVNADVMACRIAVALGECDVVIAGATAGVLDEAGGSIALLDLEGIEKAIASRTATAGMVAKLSACRTALAAGVASIRIVDGRGLGAGRGLNDVPGTRLVPVASGVRA